MGKNRHKVIMVDDSAMSLSLGKSILRDLYEVYALPSPQKLFQILEKITPDIILLDVEMPDMDGFEVIKILKADARYAGIPVIFLTGNDDETSRKEGFGLGAVDYVSKPFSGSSLIECIETHLAQDERNTVD